MSEKRQLPKLADLHHDAIVGFKDDQFNLLLSQQPAKEWVKEHPFAKGIKYLPIERVEYMLTKIFGEWRVEVQREGQMFNSVYVCVRLHLKSPITGEWFYHDGLGAVGVQTNAGASASDLSAIKQDAIMKALPAAESYAIKDAAEKLGRLFGKDLNRKEAIDFSMTFTPTLIKGNDKYDEAVTYIATGRQQLEFYERTEIIDNASLIELEAIQVQAIRDFCDTAKLDDDKKNDFIQKYMSEQMTAEAIISHIKENYGVKFIHSL